MILCGGCCDCWCSKTFRIHVFFWFNISVQNSLHIVFHSVLLLFHSLYKNKKQNHCTTLNWQTVGANIVPHKITHFVQWYGVTFLSKGILAKLSPRGDNLDCLFNTNNWRKYCPSAKLSTSSVVRSEHLLKGILAKLSPGGDNLDCCLTWHVVDELQNLSTNND